MNKRKRYILIRIKTNWTRRPNKLENALGPQVAKCQRKKLSQFGILKIENLYIILKMLIFKLVQ